MRLQTVTGLIAVEDVGLADAHAHVWIEPPVGAAPEARFELDDEAVIKAELMDFRAAGGNLVIDCQPGGCGRDGAALARLAEATGVHIAAVTGFHRQRYYPPEYWLWSASAEEASAYFAEELTAGMREVDGALRATAIKVGYEGGFEGQSGVLMEAAAEAARRTGAAILFHTERGRNAEALPPFFNDRGVPTDRLFICHMDKRPDFGLHRELAQAGALLGYDTFARPQYDPERNAWPLLKAMAAGGLGDHIAIGLDLSTVSMWRRFGGHPGMVMLAEQIAPRLRAEGIDAPTIAGMTGRNVARYLVRRTPEVQTENAGGGA